VKKVKEANIISWKLLIDSNNKLVTEISAFPKEKIKDLFDQHDIIILETALREATTVLEKLHDRIEVQLNATM
jgi:hypothetical protein|tara:strand:+ start:1278 stop:1496 length:219 start_codon:yes stop_codon:yes gene_type:complete